MYGHVYHVFVCKLESCQSSSRHPHRDSLPPITPAQSKTMIYVRALSLWLQSDSDPLTDLFLLLCMCHFTCRQNTVSCCWVRMDSAKFLCIKPKQKRSPVTPLDSYFFQLQKHGLPLLFLPRLEWLVKCIFRLMSPATDMLCRHSWIPRMPFYSCLGLAALCLY